MKEIARFVDLEKTDELAEAMYNLLSKCHLNHKVGCFADDCRECLQRFLSPCGCGHLFPITDVRPVVHGHWLPAANTWTHDLNEASRRIFRCSVCGRYANSKEPYCHCGAVMDEGGECSG